MSHASVISNLKLLIKQPITANDPGDHIEHLINESDRSSIILHAALLEEMLVAQLEKLMPTINGDERDRLFDFEGPLGSFSNRIRLSQALGVIDRATKKKAEVIKDLRNTAAHCHSRITFETPEVQAAIAWLFDKPGDAFANWTNIEVRDLFSVAVSSLAHVITSDDLEMNWTNLWNNAVAANRARQSASH